MAEGPVVCDTSPLIKLAGVGLLNLLGALYGEVWIPPSVRQEFQAKPRAGEAEIDDLPWLLVCQAPSREDLSKHVGLGDGERQAIALAQAHQARILLMDDRLGRRIASSRKIPVVGTLAVLVRARRHGLVSTLSPIVDQMIAQGRYISRSLRAEVLTAAGEPPIESK